VVHNLPKYNRKKTKLILSCNLKKQENYKRKKTDGEKSIGGEDKRMRKETAQ